MTDIILNIISVTQILLYDHFEIVCVLSSISLIVVIMKFILKLSHRLKNIASILKNDLILKLHNIEIRSKDFYNLFKFMINRKIKRLTFFINFLINRKIY